MCCVVCVGWGDKAGRGGIRGGLERGGGSCLFLLDLEYSVVEDGEKARS